MAKQRRQFNDEFKREAVRVMRSRGSRQALTTPGNATSSPNTLVATASCSQPSVASLPGSVVATVVDPRRPLPGLVFPSDRGSQYASHAFRRRLGRYRMRQSLSRRGNCWDNGVAESFFATLKKELVRSRVFDTRSQTRSEIFEYLEIFYNRQRAHSLLSYETPVAFEDCYEKKKVE